MLRRCVFLTIIAIVTTLACRGDRGPRAEPYVVAVTAEEPALSAEEIESSVAIPVEMALGKIRSVISVRTESRPGMTTVIAELSDEAGQREIRAQLDALTTLLPESVSPVVAFVAPDAPDHVVLHVHGTHPPVVLTRIARDWIVRRLERLEGVGSVTVRGGQERRLELRVDPVRLDEMGATVLDVASALAATLEVPAGRAGTDALRVGTDSLRVGTDSLGEPAGDVWQQLRDRTVVQRGASPVRVSDIATIADTVHPKQAEPLQIGIHFHRGADRERVAKAIGEALRTDVPAGVTIEAAPPVARAPRVTLIGDDRNALARAADRVARELGIVVPREPTVELHVDRERAAELGISANDVARLLGVVHGVPLARAGESADLVMRLDGVELARASDVLRIRGAQGALVPLSAVVTRRQSIDEPVRVRIDRRPAVELTVPGGDLADLRRRVAKLGLPAQIRTRVQ